MSRSAEYMQAYRAAVKDAVTFLHDEAKRMNDPAAVSILNNAAFHMGQHFSRKAVNMGNHFSRKLNPLSNQGSEE